MSAPVSIRDRRRLPFVMVTKAAIEAIRRDFDSRRGQTALAVYVAIVECANEARSESFETPRRVIAELAMVHIRILDKYVGELEALGLVHVDRQRADGRPNRWTLTDPPSAEGAIQSARVEAIPDALGEGIGDAPPPVNPACTPPVHSALQGGVHSECTPRIKERKKEKKETPQVESRGELLNLSNRLADAIRENDPKATLSPESRAWLDPLRLLIDRDGRTVAEVEQVIDWCQADEFWHTNVLSPSKLRKQFTQLRLKMDEAGQWQQENTMPIAFRRRRGKGQPPVDRDLQTWVRENPSTLELAEAWAPVRERLGELVPATAALQMTQLHIHEDGETLVIGAPSQSVRWISDRFSVVLAQAAGKPVRLIDCRCELAAKKAA